jgi:hypothetical protein
MVVIISQSNHCQISHPMDPLNEWCESASRADKRAVLGPCTPSCGHDVNIVDQVHVFAQRRGPARARGVIVRWTARTAACWPRSAPCRVTLAFGARSMDQPDRRFCYRSPAGKGSAAMSRAERPTNSSLAKAPSMHRVLAPQGRRIPGHGAAHSRYVGLVANKTAKRLDTLEERQDRTLAESGCERDTCVRAQQQHG